MLNFKNRDYTINSKYLTNKFYIQHSTNEYYNIVNASNLNYNICGFSNNKNYDTYKLENVNYIHKVANNSEWVLTNKKIDIYKRTNLFCEELFYYLFPTNKSELSYSFSYLYNSYWNNIYSESNIITKDNELEEVIIQNKDPFRKYKGFTLETTINSNISDTNSNKGIHYMSIVLTTKNFFYNIRFINYDENTLLIRITENSISSESNKLNIIKTNLKTFKQLDFVSRSTGNEIKMNICAPDIYTDNNVFNETGSKIHLTYDKEFINIDINNKLITFFRVLNEVFNNVYYSSNIEMNYTDIKWWKHDKLMDIPLWRTKNIDNFHEGKPGIEFVSKIKPTVKFQCYIEQKTIGYFYIAKDNKYLSIDYKDPKLEYDIK